ncbi:DoxX family protein [Aequorivita echinoideorum]|uniref:DoxX family protein n=1 Tax=Aequorivita echinoideorum TaxID=1549647 RepID=A0ABS5S5A5_9FLAO|nr:DoxX family protein [Aequorivita echinoideorum]MBT0607030.1 DoxX family protein [Aequorivita echinoideorum]
MKTNRIIYWVATTIICAMMLFSAGMYLAQTEEVRGIFEDLDYPAYLVVPLAVAKILGVLMILWRQPNWLMNFAYAGFFFDFILASMAHYHEGESFAFPLAAMVFLLISYFFGKTART